MEHKTLAATGRSVGSKGANTRLRGSGKIPAVVYGRSASASVAVDEHEFSQKFKRVSENTIIDLAVDGESHDVLVKDYQTDAITGRIIHIDFYEVDKNKLLRTHVPIRVTGTAQGVRGGGVLDQNMHQIEVECLPRDIPEQISVDVTSLEVGDSIHVAHLEVLPGVRYLSGAEQVVVSVTYVKEEVVAAPAAAVEGEEAAAEGAEEGEAKAEEPSSGEAK